MANLKHCLTGRVDRELKVSCYPNSKSKGKHESMANTNFEDMNIIDNAILLQLCYTKYRAIEAIKATIN
jgi:hypothetical protein